MLLWTRHRPISGSNALWPGPGIPLLTQAGVADFFGATDPEVLELCAKADAIKIDVAKTMKTILRRR